MLHGLGAWIGLHACAASLSTLLPPILGKKWLQALHILCQHFPTACSVDWFILLLVREEVLLAGLCERKIMFRLKIYDRLQQTIAKRTGLMCIDCRPW